jgi:hypothetical protein
VRCRARVLGPAGGMHHSRTCLPVHVKLANTPDA